MYQWSQHGRGSKRREGETKRPKVQPEGEIGNECIQACHGFCHSVPELSLQRKIVKCLAIKTIHTGFSCSSGGHRKKTKKTMACLQALPFIPPLIAHHASSFPISSSFQHIKCRLVSVVQCRSQATSWERTSTNTGLWWYTWDTCTDAQHTCCTKRWLKLPSILFLCTSNTSPSSNDVEPSDQRTMRALLSLISFPSSSFLYLHRIVFST